MKVRMTDNVAVFGVAKTALSEIKAGSYIGVSAMPEPDGTQKALAVHIFPENQRGAAEGFRPWDLRPNSTMTNATVAETVEGHRRPEHPGQVQGRRKESRGAAGYADRHLRRRRQVRTEAGRQDHHLRRGEEGRRHAGSQPRQCRPRRHHAADVRRSVTLRHSSPRAGPRTAAKPQHRMTVAKCLRDRDSRDALRAALRPDDRPGRRSRPQIASTWSSISAMVLTPHRPMVTMSSLRDDVDRLGDAGRRPAPRPWT